MSQQKHQLSRSSLGAEDDSEDEIPHKPKRPLTVYNLFGKLERNYIVQSHQKRATVSLETSCTEGIATERSSAAVDPYLELRPAKYRDIVLPHDWYKVGRNKIDRKLYQVHGVIEFQDLSNAVAERWGKVDDEARQFVQTIYDREMVEHRKEVEEYMKMYGDAIKRRKLEATRLAATSLSPREQSMAVSQRHPRTATVSDTASFMTQGSTYSPNYESSKKPSSATVSHANPLASTQGSNASSSYDQWNQLLNPYVASWPTNPSHFDSQPSTNHYTSSTSDSRYNAMQNRTDGCSSSDNPSTSYCPFNQPSGTTFQSGNGLNSSIGSNNSGMSGGIQAAGMSSLANHTPDLRITDYRTLNEQLNDSTYFGNQSTTTATLPMHQFQHPTEAAYSINQSSFQLDQSHFGKPMYSSERSKDTHAATKPDDEKE